MSIKNTLKKFEDLVWLCIQALFLLVGFIWNDAHVWVYICFLQVVFSVIMGRMVTGKWFSYVALYVLVLYVFHGATFLLKELNIPFYEGLNFDLFVDGGTKSRVLQYCSCAFFSFSAGIALNGRIIKKKIKPVRTEIDFSYCRKIGWILLALCVIPRLYTDIIQLIAYCTGGYQATFSVARSGIINVWADGFHIAMAFLIIGYRNNKKQVNAILVAALVYLVISMISGKRQEKVCFILADFLVYVIFVPRKKLNPVTVSIICICAYVFMVVVAAIGDARVSGTSNLLPHIFNNISPKFIWDQIGEFGYAATTLAFSMLSFPEVHAFNLGMTYLKSMALILPNIGGFIHQLDLDFVKLIPSQYQYWLGGSCFGEFFFNWADLGAWMFIFIGLLISRMEATLKKSALTGKLSLGSVASIMLLQPMFLWIRGSVTYIVRPLVWFSLLIYVIFVCIKFMERKGYLRR